MLTNKQKLQYALQLRKLHEIMVIKQDLDFTKSNANHNRAVHNLEKLQDRIIENTINNHIHGNVDSINHKPIVDMVINTTLINQQKGLIKSASKDLDKLVKGNISSYQEIMNNRLKLDAKSLEDKIEDELKKDKYQNLSNNQIKNQIKEEFKDTTKKRINRIIGDALHTNQCNISFATAQEQGYNYKVWMNGRGKGRVRPWHRAKLINAVELDDKFFIYGSYPAYMMYPGDLNGGAENVANCRCWLNYTNITPSNLKTRGTIKINSNVSLTQPNTSKNTKNTVKESKGLKTKVKEYIPSKVKTVINKVKNSFKKINKKLKVNPKEYYDINIESRKTKWNKDKSKAITINGKTIYGVGESEMDKLYFYKEYGIKKSDLTTNEFKFIKLYSGDGFIYLNGYFREVKNIKNPFTRLKIMKKYSKRWDKKFKCTNDYITFRNALNISSKTFKKGKPLKEDIILVRRQKEPMVNFSENRIYHSDSFLSTSISKKVNPKGYGDYLEYIVITKGTKIFYIEGITVTPNEFEILFDKNVELNLIEKKSDFLTHWVML